MGVVLCVGCIQLLSWSYCVCVRVCELYTDRGYLSGVNSSCAVAVLTGNVHASISKMNTIN